MSANAQAATMIARAASTESKLNWRAKAMARVMTGFSATIPNEVLTWPLRHVLAGAVKAAAAGQYGISGEADRCAVGE